MASHLYIAVLKCESADCVRCIFCRVLRGRRKTTLWRHNSLPFPRKTHACDETCNSLGQPSVSFSNTAYMKYDKVLYHCKTMEFTYGFTMSVTRLMTTIFLLVFIMFLNVPYIINVLCTAEVGRKEIINDCIMLGTVDEIFCCLTANWSGRCCNTVEFPSSHDHSQGSYLTFTPKMVLYGRVSSLSWCLSWETKILVWYNLFREQ